MNLKNKSVLVTGGTGSFGKKFTKHLLDNTNSPRIVVYSRDELKQYQILEELKETNSQDIKNNRIRFFIGDVRDLSRLNMAMDGINFVVHAAMNNLSEDNLVAPYKLIGFAALSVESATTFSTLLLIDASITF